MRHIRTTDAGFTLIEMIVAVAVFTIVVTISVGALLSLIGNNQRLQDQQNVMTTLSFALDSMTREIRTGFNYYCASRPTYVAGGSDAIFDGGDTDHEDLAETTQDCVGGNNNGHALQGISFYEGGSSISGSDRRILYFFDENKGEIFRKVGNNDAESIISSGIFIRNAEFFVSGSEPLSGGGAGADRQPTVTVFIEAAESDRAEAPSFFVQTTVTQRTLDL